MILFITISSFVLVSSLIPHNTLFKNRYTSRIIIFMLLALMIAYIPVLDVYVSDMVRYVKAFQDMYYYSLSQILQIYSWEPLFLIFQWLISRFTQDQVVFVLVTYLLFFFILLKSVKNIFIPWQRMYILFAYLCFPFFYMYVFDGLRQGIAMLLLILAISYMLDNNSKFKFFLCLILASLFHYTSIIFSIILIFIFLFKLRLRTLLVIWSITAFLFLTGLNSSILNFSFISNLDKIKIYTSSAYISGFGEVNKLNFFVFTTFFLFAALFLYKYLKLDETKKKLYLTLIKCYTGFSSAFLLFGFIAYSNRMAMYSWFLIPLIIYYPVLYKEKLSSGLLFLVVLISFATSFIYSPFIVF